MFVSKLSKKANNVLGAPKNRVVVSFIDDLSIPISDKFGDQPPLELLRYLIQNGKSNDFLEKIFFKRTLIILKKTAFMI